jgi:hypothetical protein
MRSGRLEPLKKPLTKMSKPELIYEVKALRRQISRIIKGEVPRQERDAVETALNQRKYNELYDARRKAFGG